MPFSWIFRALGLLLLWASLLIPTTVPAQENSALLQGTLENAAGAPVTDAVVHLSGTSGEARARTDSEGNFQISGLAAGQYQLTVEASGRVDEVFAANSGERGNSIHCHHGDG